MKPIITIKGLGKRYRIGERTRYGNLRESFMNSLSATVKTLRSLSRDSNRRGSGGAYIWALKDVTFDVMAGEVLGIIGNNGAGKSTLLKILSRITEPTTGRADLYGRIGSLLEVGTGFHPELTGRENIHLSAAILGMKRAEVERKFDEIVGFAEVESFVDTPVKRYSSGMYVRLAFAVAAHLDPEILLVDEVLAVGDVAFQKKCLGKIGDVARSGRTILFVSHNMTSIESLCTKAILLDGGRVRLFDRPVTVIDEYTKCVAAAARARVDLSKHPGRKPGAQTAMQEITLRSGPNETSIFRMGEGISFVVTFKVPRALRPCLGLTVKTERGARVFHVSDRFCNELASCEPALSGTVTCEIPSLELMPGRYSIDLWFEDFSVWAGLDMVSDAVSFEVVPADLLGTGRLPPASEGPVFRRAHWRLSNEPDARNASDPAAHPDENANV